MAAPLGQDSTLLPSVVKDIVTKARTTWLKNDEVLKILLHYKTYNLPIGREAPRSPGGGLLFLFNRKAVRFFRKDGHEWRKKADGKTVRETHEKLKIGNKEVLNCYYAHSEAQEALQRRCYWLLEGNEDIVLVHYLSLHPTVHSSVQNLPSMIDKPEDRPHQVGLDLARQGSGRVLNGNGIDRASSTPVESSDGCMPMSTMSTARSLDRQSSLGPLHTAPSFSAGTVQTGSTLEGPLRSSDVPLWQCGPSPQPDLSLGNSTALSYPNSAISHPGIHVRGMSDGSHPSDMSGHLPGSGLSLDLQHVQSEQEAHARAWEALKRKEREAAESTDDTLKPAASLTRVDSDTLKVAPSLSGATGGFSSEMSRHPIPSANRSKFLANPGLRCSVASPFFAAAYLGQPVMGKPQNLIEEVLDYQARSAPYSSWRQTGQHHPAGILVASSLQPAADYDCGNTERIKRYRSGDVTGSNHSFAPSTEMADLSSPVHDVTSPSPLDTAPCQGNSEQQAPLPNAGPLSRVDLSQSLLLQNPSHRPNSWLPSEEVGQIGRPFTSHASDKWHAQQPADFMQTDKFTRDFDMLLPMDLDWAMNLSSNETEDLRNCRAL